MTKTSYSRFHKLFYDPKTKSGFSQIGDVLPTTYSFCW